jgi:hypothetical protein
MPRSQGFSEERIYAKNVVLPSGRGGFIADGSGATEFALDIGGVFELYPSRRVAFRFDIGDTIIRFGGLGFTSHNLQITTGVALRF